MDNYGEFFIKSIKRIPLSGNGNKNGVSNAESDNLVVDTNMSSPSVYKQVPISSSDYESLYVC